LGITGSFNFGLVGNTVWISYSVH